MCGFNFVTVVFSLSKYLQVLYWQATQELEPFSGIRTVLTIDYNIVVVKM